MKFYLILVSLLFTAITSMAQGTPTAIEGAPPETSRQGGVYTAGLEKCPDCLKNMKDPYNGPMINTSTNPRKTASGAQGSGQQGIDGSGRDADE